MRTHFSTSHEIPPGTSAGRRLFRRLPTAPAVLLAGLCFSAVHAFADQIIIPAEGLPRDRVIDLHYRLEKPGTGTGHLSLEWSDVLGRIVDRREATLQFRHARDAWFQLDMRRAVAIQNHLRAHLSFRGVTDLGTLDRRESDTEVSFVARPDVRDWSDYQIVMWQPHTAAQNAALNELGITAGAVIANRGNEPPTYVKKQIEPLLKNDLRWYVENVATDFYSAYHIWSAGRPENWRFLELKEQYKEHPSDPSVFVRDPSLSDPAWLRRIQDRLVDTVHGLYTYRPLYYSLGDETGIADLAAYWDFDLSPHSLTGMRRWLRQQYPSLPALNAQWGSHFTSWDRVMPMLTREAMQRKDDNFSAWADFKAWMDVAFARALRIGTDAIHSADRDAYSAIEGTQIPGWGGYDYSRLATAVDAMEIYDYGNSFDIARSLNPKLTVLTTTSGANDEDIRQIWVDLLRGGRGLILWDAHNNFVREDGSLGPSARRVASDFAEIRGGLGALLINSHRGPAPVAILYSPASLRTQWMLDQRPKGEAWIERDAEAEYQDNAVRVATRVYARLIEGTGVQYRFVSSRMVELGALSRHRYKVLLLPRAIALSPDEAREIRRFVERGGLVIADSEPGTFDEHSRRLTQALLGDVFSGSSREPTATFSFGLGKAVYFALDPHDVDPHACFDQSALARMGRLLATQGLRPDALLRGATDDTPTDVKRYVSHNGRVTIVALQRDNCSELAAPETKKPNTSVKADTPVRLTLPHASFVYDVRARRELGHTDELAFALDPIEPTILAYSDAPIPSLSISGSKRVQRGSVARLRLQFAGSETAAVHVLHVEITDPTGRVIPHYSGNVFAGAGGISRRLPLALNDPLGTWRIRATDTLSGGTATWDLEVIGR